MGKQHDVSKTCSLEVKAPCCSEGEVWLLYLVLFQMKVLHKSGAIPVFSAKVINLFKLSLKKKFITTMSKASSKIRSKGRLLIVPRVKRPSRNNNRGGGGFDINSGIENTSCSNNFCLKNLLQFG